MDIVENDERDYKLFIFPPNGCDIKLLTKITAYKNKAWLLNYSEGYTLNKAQRFEP